MSAIFAGLATLLAAVGLYGVLSYVVSQRTAEIGIRMALGAQRGQVIGLVMIGGLRIVVFGLAIGLAGAAAASRLIRTLLFDVTPTDPVTYVAIVIVVAAAALVASWLPARQAAGIEPTEALRKG